MNFDTILTSIEEKVIAQALPKSMLGDRWVLSSAMHKAIRRNEPERAASAAYGLWLQDRRSLWQRLHIIALEDVGVASIDTVVKTLAVSKTSTWRKRVGDCSAALYIARLLCAAHKSRLCEQIFTCADKDRERADFRASIIKADNERLAEYALYDDVPLAERALALWALAGTDRYRSDYIPVRRGSLDAATHVMRALNAPVDLTEACIASLKSSRWPLALMMPLLYSKIQGMPRPLLVRYDAIELMSDVEGIPVYAADQYTRVGKSCIRQFKKTVPELQAFDTRQVGLGLFYAESARLNAELTSPELEVYRQTGELADADALGLCPAIYLGMKEAITRHDDLLHDIRQHELRRSLADWQDSLERGQT